MNCFVECCLFVCDELFVGSLVWWVWLCNVVIVVCIGVITSCVWVWFVLLVLV